MDIGYLLDNGKNFARRVFPDTGRQLFPDLLTVKYHGRNSG
jgi:hypothetical protein